MSRARDFARGPQLRRYEVRFPDQSTVILEAHYCFDNSDTGQGLIFRRYVNDDTESRTYVVAGYAPGFWAGYRELVDG